VRFLQSRLTAACKKCSGSLLNVGRSLSHAFLWSSTNASILLHWLGRKFFFCFFFIALCIDKGNSLYVYERLAPMCVSTYIQQVSNDSFECIQCIRVTFAVSLLSCAPRPLKLRKQIFEFCCDNCGRQTLGGSKIDVIKIDNVLVNALHKVANSLKPWFSWSYTASRLLISNNKTVYPLFAVNGFRKLVLENPFHHSTSQISCNCSEHNRSYPHTVT